MQHRNQHNQSPLPVITGAPLDGPADCTLACDEGHLTAHKIMLCAHSKYLQDILGKFPNAEHPIIILTELNITDIKILVNYMYTGELVITNDGSPTSLLRAAQILKIDSLTDLDDEDEQPQQHQYQSHNNNDSNNNNHLAHNNLNNQHNNNHNQLHHHYQQRSPSPSLSPTPSPSPQPQMASPPESPQPTQKQQQAAITTTTTTTTTTTRSRLQSQQRNHNHHYTSKHQQHQQNSPQLHRQKMKHQRTILPQPPSSISPPSQRLTLPAQLSPKRPQHISVHQQQSKESSLNGSNNKIRCHLCNIGLSDVKCLYRHVLTRHLPEKWGYKCEFCDREFSRDDHLMRHYTTKHKNMEFNREKIRETRRLNREMAKNFHDQISKLGGIDSIRNELSL